MDGELIMTFEDFLRECIAKHADVRMRAHEQVAPGGVVRFYAHPFGVDGSTVDFDVHGNFLTQVVPPAAQE